jgi:predicted SnoaL-like aldol condensation-catalyzing enzyme
MILPSGFSTTSRASVAALGTMLFLLGGCASKMSKEECRTVDWRTVGYEDGVAGQPGDRIGQHRRDCAEHGVTPNLDAYLAGRAAGLREYCQPHNGYRAGVNGYTYFDVCPAELAPEFVKAYEDGRALYVREQRVRDTDAAIEYRRQEIRRLEDRATESAFDVIDKTATPEQRTQGALDAKQAAERIIQLKREITTLEQERAQYQAELEAYRRTVEPR